MFKGLRTKIESEQKGQPHHGSIESNRTSKVSAKPDHIAQEPKSTQIPYILDSLPSELDQVRSIQSQSVPTTSQTDSNLQGKKDTPDKHIVVSEASSSISKIPLRDSSRKTSPTFEAISSLKDESDVAELKSQISMLNDQLRSVMKEKDESNDQNSQLYQLIEKLRRSLEIEKAANSNLRNELEEVQSKLQEQCKKTQDLEQSRSTNISIRTFDSSRLSASGFGKSDNVDVLRNDIMELQAQLSKKNRLLKVSQQNSNDLKKTLQREILEHGKTQEDLEKLKSLVKMPGTVQNNCDRCNIGAQHNGSRIENNNIRNESNTIEDSRDMGHYDGPTSMNDDTISMNFTRGGSATQLDGISYVSRSSASVDDLESNDLQSNLNSREVNQEYLRNVLFRYMTSTDSEKTSHLIKAISVLMNFTPEQSAAIKSANSIKNSWLKLR